MVILQNSSYFCKMSIKIHKWLLKFLKNNIFQSRPFSNICMNLQKVQFQKIYKIHNLTFSTSISLFCICPLNPTFHFFYSQVFNRNIVIFLNINQSYFFWWSLNYSKILQTYLFICSRRIPHVIFLNHHSIYIQEWLKFSA